MNKKIIISTIIIFVMGAGALYASLIKSTPEKESTIIPITTESNQQENEDLQTNAVKTYSLSEIALHKTENDCWTSINGKVYNITELIPNHPAGKEKIMKGCGIDATTIFSRVPKHDLDLLKQNIMGDLK